MSLNISLPDLPSGFSLHVTVHIKPSDVEEFFTLFKKVFDLVAAEKECLYFEVFQDPLNPGTISWVENWDCSPQWFMENQITKEYMYPYLLKTEEMFVKPREFKILERVGKGLLVSKEGNVR